MHQHPLERRPKTNPDGSQSFPAISRIDTHLHGLADALDNHARNIMTGLQSLTIDAQAIAEDARRIMSYAEQVRILSDELSNNCAAWSQPDA